MHVPHSLLLSKNQCQDAICWTRTLLR